MAADLRDFARAALTLTDEQLAAECDWQPVALRDAPPQLRVSHRLTGLRVSVEARATDAETRFIALLYLRNLFYDLTRTRGSSKK